MSNYSQVVSYGPKDSLTNGDPNKVIKGVQIDAEFQAISSSIATKQDTPLTTLNILGVAGNNAAQFNGVGGAGLNNGISIIAGTNAADHPLLVSNSSSAPFFLVRGDGQIFGGPSQVNITPDAGSFTLTGTGFSAPPTATATWTKIGNFVLLHMGTMSGTSTTTSMTVTGLPSNLQPVTTASMNIPVFGLTDNGQGSIHGAVQILMGSGTINILLSSTTFLASKIVSGNGFFTASGTKGYSNIIVAYSVL